MIKYISNIITGNETAEISIDTVIVANNEGIYSFEYPVYYQGQRFYSFNCTKELFVKVKLNNLFNNDKIRHSTFNITLICNPSNVVMRLYQLSEDITSFGNNPVELHNKLYRHNAYLIDQAFAHQVSNYGDSSSIQQTISFDITNLVNQYDYVEDEFVFAIVTDNAAEDTVYFFDPSFVSMVGGLVSTAVISQSCGLNHLNKYDNVSFSNYDTGYVNIYNGELVHLFNTFSTISKKMPIAISFAHYYDRTAVSNLLPYKLKFNFEYDIYFEYGILIIEEYTGNRLAYKKISKELDSTYYEELGIKHLEHTGDLYFCNEDGSYLYKDMCTAYVIMVEKYDMYDNYTKFLVYSSNSSFEFGNNIKTQIKKIVDKKGSDISFSWEEFNPSTNKINSITNSSNDEVIFTYNNQSLISTIQFSNEDKYVSFLYDSIYNKVKYDLYDNHDANNPNILLSEIEIDLFNNERIQTAMEFDSYLSSKRRIDYSYIDDKVSNVSFIDKDYTLVGETNYTYDDDYTKVSSLNDEVYYYFDKYGRVRTIINNNGLVQTTNYGEIEDGVLKGALSISNPLPLSRNLLENHSFEYTNNNGNIMSWIKTGVGEVSLSDDSLYGEKCLFVNTMNGQDLSLYQELVNTGTGTFSLKCKAKGLASGTVSIKVGIYDRTNPNNSTIYSTNLTNLTDEWKEYSCNAVIGTLSINQYVRVDINSISNNQVYIDDMEFGTLSQFIRYNLIENANLEKVYNDTPSDWQFTNRTIQDCTETINDSELLHIFGLTAMYFCDYSYTTGDNNFLLRKMYKIIDYSGNKKDKFSFGVFAKGYVTNNNIFRSFISFEYENIGEKKYYFDFEKGLSGWQLLSREIIAEDDYEAITVGIEYNGPKEMYVDAFQLCKDSSFKYYNYDRRGRLVEAISENGNYQKISYKDYLPTEITMQDGSFFKYSYLSDGRLKKITDLNGNTVTYYYGLGDQGDNLTQVSISKGSETITHYFTYDQDDNLVSETDEFSNSTAYTYDYLKRVNAVNFPDGSVQSFSYDNISNLIELSGFTSSSSSIASFKNTINYDYSLDSVYMVTSNSGKLYSFLYDSNGRLLSISENGNTVHSFEYEHYIGYIQTNLVTSKEYVASGDVFSFSYDAQNRLTTVSLNNDTLYEYEYNELSLISLVKDYYNNTTKYYSYDFNGNLVRVTNGELVIKYEHDKLGNIQEKKIKEQSKQRVQQYDYDYEFNDYTKQEFLKRLGNIFGDEVVLSDHLGNGEYGLKYKNKNVEYYYDTNIKSNLFDFNDKRLYIQYNFSTINSNRQNDMICGKYFNLNHWKFKFSFTKTIYMIIKPSGSLGNVANLLKLRNSITNQTISSIDIDETGHITYTKEGSSTPTITTNGTISLNNWNFISFSMVYGNGQSMGSIAIKNNTTNPTEGVFVLTEYPYCVDEVIVSMQPSSSSQMGEMSSSSSHGEFDMSMPFKVSIIGFSNVKYSDIQCKTIYDGWIKYCGNNSNICNDSTSYYNVTSEAVDFISLNGNAESLRGLKPYYSILPVDSFDVDRETCFQYDNSLMRKVYSCYHNDGFNPLAYERSFGMQGTLSFWFRLDDDIDRDRYLLSIVNNNSVKLRLFVNHSTLYIVNNGITNTYSNLVNDSLWHNIILTWSNGYMSLGFDGVAKGAFTFSFLGSSLFCFGSLQNDKTYALNGYIESIYISDMSQSYSSGYIESVRPKTIGYMKDSLGRVTAKKIVIGNNSFNTNYLYDKTRITTETFYNEDSVNYSYDNMGNVSEIAYADRSVYYEYDKLGRLTNHTNDSYTEGFYYNSNGDITEIFLNNGIDNDFVYSYDNKHRLTSVKNNSINYRVLEYPINSFYPSSIKFYNNGNQGKNIGFTWEGKRLVGASFSGIPVIEFKYDENGIMTYRSTPGGEFYFALEGSNVISLRKESNGGSYNSIVLDFTYDSNNMLAGLTYNNKEYFYVRDILGNIYGIINSSGNYIIKYDYTAYGEVTKNIIASSGDDLVVANHNPFMYKGYYYDSDLECYYLKSRFYMPSICRFISPDDHSYLEYEDLRGINLYAYCGNNPVMYVDGDGHSPEWYDIIACIGVGLFVASAIVLTAGLAGAVMGGIAGGIIYGAAIGTVALGIVGAGVGAVGGMIYDAANGNDFGTSVWTWTKSGFGIGAIGGAVIGGVIGGAAAYSVTGLTNASFWTGLGPSGDIIAGQVANSQGLITIGQTFGGKVAQFMTNRFGYVATKYIWASLSKTMASTVAMNSVVLFYGGTISATSIYMMYEYPELVRRGIEIIQQLIGG